MTATFRCYTYAKMSTIFLLHCTTWQGLENFSGNMICKACPQEEKIFLGVTMLRSQMSRPGICSCFPTKAAFMAWPKAIIFEWAHVETKSKDKITLQPEQASGMTLTSDSRYAELCIGRKSNNSTITLMSQLDLPVMPALHWILHCTSGSRCCRLTQTQ